MSYGIKAGYIEREHPRYYHDWRDEPIVSQPLVYPYALSLAVLYSARTVIDLGCGRATKLAKLRGRWRTIGVDYGPNLDWCQRHGPDGIEWWEFDLERRVFFDVEPESTVVIAADVIEHLRDPTAVLDTIREVRPLAAVISTPDRDATWGTEHNGPPPNNCHVREWNRDELVGLLEAHGLTVCSVDHTASDDVDWLPHTLLVVAR